MATHLRELATSQNCWSVKPSVDKKYGTPFTFITCSAMVPGSFHISHRRLSGDAGS
jgi:hypothetical protein